MDASFTIVMSWHCIYTKMKHMVVRSYDAKLMQMKISISTALLKHLQNSRMWIWSFALNLIIHLSAICWKDQHSGGHDHQLSAFYTFCFITILFHPLPSHPHNRASESPHLQCWSLFLLHCWSLHNVHITSIVKHRHHQRCHSTASPATWISYPICTIESTHPFNCLTITLIACGVQIWNAYSRDRNLTDKSEVSDTIRHDTLPIFKYPGTIAHHTKTLIYKQPSIQ